VITYGHSKDHRPDLKQLLFILTMTADGKYSRGVFAVPTANASDSRNPHRGPGIRLRAVAGRSDFLYVADSKTMLAREHGLHGPCGRALRHRDAPQTVWKTPSFVSGSRPAHLIGPVFGDRPNPRHSDGPRATTGMSIGRRYRLPKLGQSCGSGVRYSPYARKPRRRRKHLRGH